MIDISRTDQCYKCHGPLCISRGTVCCERCGQPQPEHPATAEIEAARKAEREKPLPPPVVQSQHYVASLPERVTALERRLAALESLVNVPQKGKRAS